MKSTDWSKTPIYFHYLKNPREFKSSTENVYSDEELKYHLSYLNKLSEEEGESLVSDYEEKTLATLEDLLRHMNMELYIKKIVKSISDKS